MEIKSTTIDGESVRSITVDYYPETDSVVVFIHTKPGALNRLSEKIGKKIETLESKERPKKVDVISFRKADGVSIF